MKYILGLLLFLPMALFAQEGVGELDIQALQSQEIVGNAISNNIASIEQIGSFNEATSLQELNGSGGNFLIVSQQGNSNSGYISQSGANLATQLMQLNSSNAANIWLIGNNLSINTSQNGMGNGIDAYMESYGNNEINSSLSQEGNQNVIEFAVVNGAGFNPGVNQTFNITQFGNNHSVTAQYQDFGAPSVNITQNPGFGGAGMSISVSTIPGFTYPNR